MNWLQRYGLSGAYFWGLIFLMIYSFNGICIDQIKILLAAATITFIPLGYIINALQQILYLRIPSLGLHRLVKEENNFEFKNIKILDLDDEPTVQIELEAYTYLCVSFYRKFIKGGYSIKDEDRPWIRKRMDVLAISFSFIIASALYSIILFSAIVYNLIINDTLPHVIPIALCIIASNAVILIMIYLWQLLRSQICIVTRKLFKIFEESKENELKHNGTKKNKTQ